ncbi:MAG: hypothetical protein CM15mV25_0140 [uncultured marine virus]|nr:MAG: hypothetical protein CM15mV25_0140 [uncultured marine virus]
MRNAIETGSGNVIIGNAVGNSVLQLNNLLLQDQMVLL